MSESYDLKCITCNVWAGMDWNHGGHDLARIWDKREEIAAVARISIPEIEIRIESWRGPFPLDFFAAHKDHDVQPWSEYGHALKTCWKTIPCGSCGHHNRCALDVGHAPPCAAKGASHAR